MSDRVSFTSNTSNAGLREPLELPGWSIPGIDSVNLGSSLLTPKGQRRCLDYGKGENSEPSFLRHPGRKCAEFGWRNRYTSKVQQRRRWDLGARWALEVL